MAEFLEALGKTCNVKLACDSVGINRQLAYRHKASNPVFAEKWLDALDDGVDMLAAEARRRAGGIKRDVWYKGKVVGQELECSDTLLIFLLKSHRPEQYRDNYDIGKAVDNVAGRKGK